jgi:GDPmannose 4,6-dehydratase
VVNHRPLLTRQVYGSSQNYRNKGYQVHGIVRRASTFNTERLDSIYADPHEQSARLYLHYGDVTDGSGLRHVIEKVQPREIYNLAAQSHVRVSFDQPEYTGDVVATGTLRLLEAVRDYVQKTSHQIRFYQAGSSKCSGHPNRRKTKLLRSIRAALTRSAKLPRIGTR